MSSGRNDVVVLDSVVSDSEIFEISDVELEPSFRELTLMGDDIVELDSIVGDLESLKI